MKEKHYQNKLVWSAFCVLGQIGAVRRIMARKATKSMLFDLVYFDHKQFISYTKQAHHINNYLNNELNHLLICKDESKNVT